MVDKLRRTFRGKRLELGRIRGFWFLSGTAGVLGVCNLSPP